MKGVEKVIYQKIVITLKKYKNQRLKKKRIIGFKKKILKLQKELDEQKKICSLDSLLPKSDCKKLQEVNVKEKILKMYFEKQMKPVEISKELNLEKYKITRILQKDPRYIEEKKLRKDKSYKRHIQNTEESNKIKRKIKQFKNNADDLILKNMHNQASSELSGRRKLTNNAYREWNKSAYKYNENKKRYEFRDELGKSCDVPKFINVEV